MNIAFKTFLLAITLCFFSQPPAEAKSHRVRALDDAIVSVDVSPDGTNQVVTIEISEGKPNQKFILECTADLTTWNTLASSRLSDNGVFSFRFTSTDTKCFFRVRHGK